MAIKASDCHAMTTYYEKLFEARYGSKPNVNRYSARWGFDSVLQSMSKGEAQELLDYYFTTPATKRYDLDWFFYHYHELVAAKEKSEKEKTHRLKLMEESKKRAEEWRASGKPSITDN